MGYCKKFIHGIHAINFTGPSAELLRNSLIIFAYQELKREHELISKALSELSKNSSERVTVTQQLKQYQEKQKECLHQVGVRMQAISDAYRDLFDLDTEPDIADLPTFIKAFAQNFRDIKHLAYTLSDAPPTIKKLQTQLYIEVLSKLDPSEKEIQLKNLSLPNIQDMIVEAIRLYENNPADIELANQCKKLVHMSFYEIIRRDCDGFIPEEGTGKYIAYQQFIRFLNFKLIDVKQSSIIDNLSSYKASDGRFIEALLGEVERKLEIGKMGDWVSDDKLNALKIRKELFHALRFGQEDRREYVKKIQANLARDLFWARNIRDIELFTKSKITDETFASLVQKHYLKQDQVFKRAHKEEKYKPGLESRYIKLQDLLEETYVGAKKKGLKKGDKATPFKSVELDIEKHIKDIFSKQVSKPTVRLLSDGDIEITLFYINYDKSFIKNLIHIIGENGGFNRLVDKSLMDQFLKSDAITEKVTGLTLQGKSIAVIEQQIAKLSQSHGMPLEQVHVFQAGLNRVKTTINETRVSEISHLKLDNSDELLLRKLLELYSIYTNKLIKDALNAPTLQSKSKTSLALERAFKHIDAGHFKEALQTPGIDAFINDAYRKLSLLNPENKPNQVKHVIEKSSIIASSARERLTKTAELESAFKSGIEIAKKVDALFVNEYHAMESTLNLKVRTEVKRMEEQITEMSEEIARLHEHTQQGKPALHRAEQDAYFLILKQIATAIDPKDISEVQFKVKHSLRGKHKVQVSDAKGLHIASVPIDVGDVTLPYSLVKPAKGEFILSYGGSRGILAPFEGLDESYCGGSKKKGRLFTHSRLLGVGQYGSVKEVESLLFGLNQVIKKGYVPHGDATPTFKELSRHELRTRPITSRDDHLYRIESDVLQNLSRAQQEKYGPVSGSSHYWIENDKTRTSGKLFFKTSAPRQYQILTERAKGDTYTDTANKKLNLYTKSDIAYHDPLLRGLDEQEMLHSLKDSLELSEEIVTEAQRFAALGFAHNDIKPENFLYKRSPDGSYQVKYIDWATGGFERTYQRTIQSVEEVFVALFGSDLPKKIQGDRCFDLKGRYVEKSGLEIRYGINPTLQILHGARNGTLPYISPTVLGTERDAIPASGGIPRPELNTLLKNNQPSLDNWALTAMIFGVCNRHAYFTLVKGRAVTDYVVPGILDVDGKKTLGLKVVDVAKFNQFFACGKDAVTQESDLYAKKDALMFIPSNQGEGEPLHLYRRLQKIQDLLRETLSAPSQFGSQLPEKCHEQKIIKDIETILVHVRAVIASGEGLNKIQLREIISASKQCIKNYENLHDAGHKLTLAHSEVLQAIFNEHNKSNFTADDLLVAVGELKRIDILCSYPNTKEQSEKTIAILNHALDESQFCDKFVGVHAPCRFLLVECISKRKSQILNSLFAKISQANPAFIAQVQADGLLHYAAEQGMTDVFSTLISALIKTGAAPEKIFELMMTEYGPNKAVKTAPYIKWSTNVFHIAIRNNNKEQLTAILNLLPPGHAYDEHIKHALHLSAVLGNKSLFNQIITKYNEINLEFADHITPEKILGMFFPPESISPFHLFLIDENNSNAIPFDKLKTKAVAAKAFLLTPPPETEVYPLLIAAKHGNYSGVKNLIQLGDDIGFSKAEFAQFFTQSDEHGKNIINYLLEQGQFSVLTEVLANIKSSCKEPEKVLVYLLSNPFPVNPLRNFLNTEKNGSHQFRILNQLFDEISPDFRARELQEYRIVAFLVNEEWIIETANNINYQTELRKLLHNDKLSIELKLGFFKKLMDDAPRGSHAQVFFSKLFAEISPSHQIIDKAVTVELPLAILKEIAIQRSDLHSIIQTLTRELKSKDLTQEKELQKKLPIVTTPHSSAKKAFFPKVILEKIKSDDHPLARAVEYAAADELSMYRHRPRVTKLLGRNKSFSFSFFKEKTPQKSKDDEHEVEMIQLGS